MSDFEFLFPVILVASFLSYMFMKKSSLILLAFVTAFCCACRTQKHVVTQSEQQTQTTGSHTAVQVLQSFDSLLHTVNFSADSVVVEIIPAAPQPPSALSPIANTDADALTGNEPDGGHASGKPAEAGKYPLTAHNCSPTLKIVAHRPQVSVTRQENNLVIAQQVERDSAASSVLANSHADVSDDKVGVASPMNGTVVIVIVLLAVLLIAAVFLWLFLRKYKII